MGRAYRSSPAPVVDGGFFFILRKDQRALRFSAFGFWHAMDTEGRITLTNGSNDTPWMVWMRDEGALLALTFGNLAARSKFLSSSALR